MNTAPLPRNCHRCLHLQGTICKRWGLLVIRPETQDCLTWTDKEEEADMPGEPPVPERLPSIEVTEEERQESVSAVANTLVLLRNILGQNESASLMPDDVAKQMRLDERRLTRLQMILEGNWIRLPRVENPRQ